MIRKEARPFYRTISGVRLCWELEEPKGPKGAVSHELQDHAHHARIQTQDERPRAQPRVLAHGKRLMLCSAPRGQQRGDLAREFSDYKTSMITD